MKKQLKDELHYAFEKYGTDKDQYVKEQLNNMEAYDLYLFEHCIRVMRNSLMIGEYAKLSHKSLQELMVGSLLHDLGKLKVPKTILNKEESLTDDEIDIIRSHTDFGVELYNSIESTFDTMIVQIIEAHHEKFDGTGYPRGLAHDDIPIMARIVSVADAFDAMVEKRTYRNYVKSIEEALKEILECRGKQFDPTVVRIFISAYNATHDQKLNMAI